MNALMLNRILGTRRTIIALLMVFLIISVFSSLCRAAPEQEQFKPSAEALARVSDKPTAYYYKPQEGTLDEQSRAHAAGEARQEAIARNGRYGNAGLYAIAALLLGVARVILWRRNRISA